MVMKIISYSVIYLDDDYCKHYTVAKTLGELKFIMDRFTNVKFFVEEVEEN